MIKALTAHTSEIDNIEEAIKTIKKQLNIENELCANSIGIVACHYEFINSGALKAICNSLPFDTVGTISMNQAVNGEIGTLLFTLIVLTSDDAVFSVKTTDSLIGKPAKSIEKAYTEAASLKSESPSLVLTFAPFIVENFGDEYVDVFTRVSGGIPCFGTIAIDDTETFENCLMIYNGDCFLDQMAMVLIYADINPRFLLATISNDKILDNSALVTKSNNQILQEVNNRPVVEYFEDLDLTSASEEQYAMASIPFMLDYNDGTPPVSKVFIGLSPDNHAICAGIMPEGSSMYIGVFDKDGVLLTTGEALNKALEDIDGASCMLMYSCISRSMSLGSDLMAELDLVQNKLGNKLPFLMAYSGGEMCPTQLSNTKAINRFHNNTFIACIL